MRHTGAPVAADDAVPGGLVQLVKVLLHTLGDVLLGGVGAQRVHRTLHRRLLHVRRHVCRLNLQLGGRVGGCGIFR